MDAQQWWVAVAALVVGSAAAWGAAAWWFGRKLKAAAAQQDKLAKAREFAAQQAAQARKQIEVLQKELGELRLAVKPHRQHSEAQPAPEVLLPVIGTESTPRSPPADGFADTQVLLPRKR